MPLGRQSKKMRCWILWSSPESCQGLLGPVLQVYVKLDLDNCIFLSLKLEKRAAHVQLERHMINFKKSKSEKSKSILFDFPMFGNSKRCLFTFQLFDFSTFRNSKKTPFHFSTFRNWQWSLFTFRLSTFRIFLWLVWLLVFLSHKTVVCLYNGRTLAPRKTHPAKKQKSNSEKNVSTQTHVMLESQIYPNTIHI